jgi:hypothetical protein
VNTQTRAASDGSTPRRALRTTDAARYLGISASWLRKKRLRGLDDPGDPGPEYIRISPVVVVYEVSALDRWLDAKRTQAAPMCLQSTFGESAP